MSFEEVRIVVPCEPVAKGRARAVSSNGSVVMYTPSKTKNFESVVGFFSLQAMRGKEPIAGPVGLEFEFCMPIPKSWSKQKQDDAESGLILPANKPDLSNLIKSAEDGMNGIVYIDDGQITKLSALKKYSKNVYIGIRVNKILNNC